ncbi:type III secretion protein [Pseudomonas syringae pv. avii]|uniref:Type III secretion protein n=3 Tax=Pseudomonas TaxID=286 RepID=A0ABY1U3D9_PSESX|nr:type III secretion protein [Pseudomonas syringae pv. avii]RMR21269.1 Type III secretion protein HrpD [Pseudomonas syringae pv. persicae]SOQ07451.1 type III secretion protein HrpD [Pseudomonas syringae pv. persicae]SOQ07504.1 type III secretion protein HrpD [Pseudomonas syringae pv. persicae]SOS25817.1 type III secretion protein [Pseudomonas syringae pv. avii]
MMSLSAEDHWVHWWCNPWQWAHSQWHDRFASARGLSVSDCDALMASRHGVFLQSLGIDPAQPPAPAEPVLRWLALTPSQREQAISLAQCICFSRNESDGPDGQWCWGLTKALRPGVWLEFEHEDARLLLGAWLGPQYWSRLRLEWPPNEVPDTPGKAPENKLQALWQAIMWRVTAA